MSDILSRDFDFVDPKSIKILRDDRQRKEIDTEDLDPSIAARGVLLPLIVHREDMTLVAGERRLTSALKLGLTSVPVRWAERLSTTDLQLVELEENVKRSQLTWQEECLALLRIHEILSDTNEDWSRTKTAQYTGLDNTVVHRSITVGEELRAGNPKILNATGTRPAARVLENENARKAETAMSELMQDIGETLTSPRAEPMPAPTPNATVAAVVAVAAEAVAASPSFVSPILNTSFLDWAPAYTGQTFNFLHCDFPYGINHEKSKQGSNDRFGSYEDGEEIYWDLLDCLATNFDRIMSPSAHMMFWYSMEYHTETLEFFADRIPQMVVQKFPLIWHKTDNKGMLPDAQRGPRRVYETALIGTVGDRKIISPVSNVYGAPTSKLIHRSEKPEPMLKHFFKMFIDQSSRVIDPTCGSANALRAAEELGAEKLLGIELSPEFAAEATAAYVRYRGLKVLSKETKE